MNLAKPIKIAINILFHLIAVAIVGLAFWPIARWYYFHRPILGVDFFNTVSHVRLFAENFSLPSWAYRYFWFGGSPLYSDFSIGWYYPISLLARFITIISAVKISMLASFFLFLVFTYLAVQRLSNHHFFSAVVTTLIAFSANIYGSLTWGGSLPYFANQLFFPLSLWLLASYLDTGRRGWFWASALVVGLSFLGHASNAGAFVFVSASVLLLVGWRKLKLGFKGRISEYLLFLLVLILVSYRVSFSLFSGLIESVLGGRLFNPFGEQQPIISGVGGESLTADTAQRSWEQSRFDVLFSDTNQWLFALIGIAIAVLLVALVMDREKKRAIKIIPWFFLAGYSILHVFANSYYFPFLPQGWYRAFWHFPVTLSLFIAVTVGYIRFAGVQ
jgi:hypothetical protein